MEETKAISETAIFPFSYRGDGARFVNKESRRMMEQIRKICFPKTSCDDLKDNDVNDIRALEAHAYWKLDYFLTLNTNDFIKNRKKEMLEKIGICVREPNVAFLKELKILLRALKKR